MPHRIEPKPQGLIDTAFGRMGWILFNSDEARLDACEKDEIPEDGGREFLTINGVQYAGYLMLNRLGGRWQIESISLQRWDRAWPKDGPTQSVRAKVRQIIPLDWDEFMMQNRSLYREVARINRNNILAALEEDIATLERALSEKQREYQELLGPVEPRPTGRRIRV